MYSRRRFYSMNVTMSRTSIHKGLVLLIMITAFLLVVAGTVSAGKMAVSFTSPSIKNSISHLSSSFLVQVINHEIPLAGDIVQAPETEKPRSASAFFFHLLTDLNPADPSTFLGRELPGINRERFELLVAADGVDYSDFGYESPPPGDDVFVSRDPGETSSGKPNTGLNTKGNGSETDQVANEDQHFRSRQKVFIYHTHNRESWLTIPELKDVKDPGLATHPSKNITLVGQRLGEELKKLGVEVEVSTEDHMGKTPYSMSYASSRKTVQEAIVGNSDFQYFFDLHRDADEREDTTITIDGKSYAQIYFVIGKGNPNWEKNLAFAETLHERINKKYPGLSKGIIGKSAKEGHGEYNQSLSTQSVIVEIGGYQNTLEESYRTAEIFARVIAETYFDAERVNAPTESKRG